jgi:hypothetical protein
MNYWQGKQVLVIGEQFVGVAVDCEIALRDVRHG